MYKTILFLLLSLISLPSCQHVKADAAILNKAGTEIETRFSPPEGYHRVEAAKNSFAYYLRHLKLKPSGSKVLLFDKSEKWKGVYEAVVDMEIGNKDLQQCADAVIRLRAEYLFAQKRYDEISFTFTSGFEASYSKWMEGYRIEVKKDKARWEKLKEPSISHESFRGYLDIIFSYCGSKSLSKTLTKKKVEDIEPGDVFIRGGFPGHAVTVMDVCLNSEGKKMFMIAQSYMPAQDIQILKNENDSKYSPWYSIDFGKELETPEWTFKREELRTW